MSKHKGKFITFEGVDKTGKSTQSQMTADYLRANNIEVLQTREPGGTGGAEKIRELVMNTDGFENTTECLLMLASRYENLYKNIIPALNEGKWVICDRFNHSTLAYQGAKLMQNDNDYKWMKLLTELIKSARVNIEPDVTVYMSTSLKKEKGLSSSNDVFENRDNSYYNKVSKIYDHLAKNDKKIINISSLDDKGDVIPPEKLNKLIIDKINEKIYGKDYQRGN